ncbi:UNKNOWN [Stylonychia lemnae]|uniref:Protein kinase domain-containing protein n=1 Tax=Stylonychia lemnae TaxID=5949 RepID=A0A078AYG9_STYLE|nr:UNKNOWN [Stylonychia lemnae]|eukprot:CDW87460.1 UNKNOWN [Stylonychia lemnae]
MITSSKRNSQKSKREMDKATLLRIPRIPGKNKMVRIANRFNQQGKMVSLYISHHIINQSIYQLSPALHPLSDQQHQLYQAKHIQANRFTLKDSEARLLLTNQVDTEVNCQSIGKITLNKRKSSASPQRVFQTLKLLEREHSGESYPAKMFNEMISSVGKSQMTAAFFNSSMNADKQMNNQILISSGSSKNQEVRTTIPAGDNSMNEIQNNEINQRRRSSGKSSKNQNMIVIDNVRVVEDELSRINEKNVENQDFSDQSEKENLFTENLNTEHNSVTHTINNPSFFVSEDSSMREEEIFSSNYQQHHPLKFNIKFQGKRKDQTFAEHFRYIQRDTFSSNGSPDIIIRAPEEDNFSEIGYIPSTFKNADDSDRKRLLKQKQRKKDQLCEISLKQKDDQSQQHIIYHGSKPIIIGGTSKNVRKKIGSKDRKASFLQTQLGSSDSIKTANEKSLISKNALPKHRVYYKLVNNVLIPVRPKRKKEFSPQIDAQQNMAKQDEQTANVSIGVKRIKTIMEVNEEEEKNQQNQDREQSVKNDNEKQQDIISLDKYLLSDRHHSISNQSRQQQNSQQTNNSTMERYKTDEEQKMQESSISKKAASAFQKIKSLEQDIMTISRTKNMISQIRRKNQELLDTQDKQRGVGIGYSNTVFTKINKNERQSSFIKKLYPGQPETPIGSPNNINHLDIRRKQSSESRQSPNSQRKIRKHQNNTTYEVSQRRNKENHDFQFQESLAKISNHMAQQYSFKSSNRSEYESISVSKGFAYESFYDSFSYEDEYEEDDSQNFDSEVSMETYEIDMDKSDTSTFMDKLQRDGTINSSSLSPMNGNKGSLESHQRIKLIKRIRKQQEQSQSNIPHGSYASKHSSQLSFDTRHQEANNDNRKASDLSLENNTLDDKDKDRAKNIGNFAKVYECNNENDNKTYAMKIIKKKKLNRQFNFSKKKAQNFLETEMADHPNVLALYEIINEAEMDKLYLITELLQGSLAQKINGKKPLTEEEIRFYFRDLISALEYCHDCAQVIHRDIKPENILIDENNRVRLADFGVSHIMENGHDTINNRAGSNFYFSPEIILGNTYKGKPADIWACGVTLYYMLTKKFPFMSNRIQELQTQIVNDTPDLDLIQNVQIRDLLEKIFIKDPAKRITLTEITKHMWLTKDGTDMMPEMKKQKIVITDKDLKSVFTRVVKMRRVLNRFRGKSTELDQVETQNRLKSNMQSISNTNLLTISQNIYETEM